jgi:transposase-like protein
MREVCRRIGVSEQSYYRWRREYGGLKVDQARRLKELEQENMDHAIEINDPRPKSPGDPWESMF